MRHLVLLLTFVAVPGWAQPMLKAEAALPNVVHPDGAGGGASAQRGRGGFFWFDTQVNGAALSMALDTGATFVSLRHEDAGRAGLDTGGLRYTVPITTPNGRTDYAPVTLARLTIGGITVRNVRAVIAPPGKLEVNLLGQTFLSRIGGFRQEGDRLTLTGSP